MRRRSNARSPPGRRSRPRGMLLGILAGACALWLLVPPPPAWVESVYSRGLYRLVAAVLVPVVDSVPFSASAALALALLAGIVAAAALSWRRRRRAGVSRPRILLGWLLPAAWVLVGGYALFVLLWGANYRREGLDGRLGLEVLPPSTEEVRAFAVRISEEIGGELPAPAERDARRALGSLVDGLERLVEEWDSRAIRLPRRVKRLPAGTLLAFGNTGVTTPLLEAHVDGGEHEVSFLAVAAHELAHAAGLCSEADADLAAVLAGLGARDPYARYATRLRLLGAFIASLPREEALALAATLPGEARADLAAIREARARYHVPSLAKVQRTVYDAYLRSQGVREGIREYSFVVKLVLAAERKGIVPHPEG